jgi:hypothetical protein
LALTPVDSRMELLTLLVVAILGFHFAIAKLRFEVVVLFQDNHLCCITLAKIISK